MFFDAYGTLIHFSQDPSPFDYMADAVRRAGVDLPRSRLDAALHAEMRYFKAHFAAVRTAEDFERLKLADARVYVEELGDTGPVCVSTLTTWLPNWPRPLRPACFRMRSAGH